jgi:transcriptional regulator with XRE-family HTH domain
MSRDSIGSRFVTIGWYMRPLVNRDQLRRAFADTVRILRGRVGLSQEKLARQAGVDRGYMGGLEREKHTPTLESIFRLLPILDVTFVEFAKEFERVLYARRPPEA